MKIVIFAIVWVIGIVVALLGNRKLREYKDYYNPKLFLVLGIFLCVFMSWAMVLAMLMDGTFEFPKAKNK